jgi:ribosomal protein S18 acetylase RimI-like enzyme
MIRLLKKSEIKTAAAIVGVNYSKKYELSCAKELRDMFGKAAIKPVYFVATEKGKIVGFAAFIQSWMDYSIYQIFWVNVLPEKQGQGIGKKLVARIIREIKKKKDACLILLTADAEKNNHLYYKQHYGFKTIEIFDRKKYQLMALSLEKKKHSAFK